MHTMEGSSHAARSEDAPDWNLLVRRRLPHYLLEEKSRMEKHLARIWWVDKIDFPTPEHLEDHATMEDLDDTHKFSMSKKHEIEEALSLDDPVEWLLGGEYVKPGLKSWTLLQAESSHGTQDRNWGWIVRQYSQIYRSCMEVFMVVGVHLTSQQKRDLREHIMYQIYRFRAPVGDEDTFRQMGLIWESFRAEHPKVRDLPVYDTLVDKTVSNRLVTTQ